MNIEKNIEDLESNIEKSTKIISEMKASEELLNTLKSIDSTLKRIEQDIRHPYKNKDYECPF